MESQIIFCTLVNNQFSVSFIWFITKLQCSSKITNTSVKNNSTSDTLHCYMFRSLRNHHQANNLRHLKHATIWRVRKIEELICYSNILLELPDSDSLQIETRIKAGCHLLNWVTINRSAFSVILFILLLSVTQRNFEKAS